MRFFAIVFLLGLSVFGQEKKNYLMKPERIRVSNCGFAQPILIYKINPEYPRILKENHLEGSVRFFCYY